MTTTAIASRQYVTLDDFMTGLLASLAVEGITKISIRGTAFYAATEAAFKQMRDDSVRHNLTLRFRVSRNAVYGDSADVREGITKAVQRDLISLDNPVYLDMTLKVTADDGPAYLQSLPGGPDAYREAAVAFLAAYAH